jgi:hypothetical protein
MSSLPREVDFSADPAATPSRMNKAMEYLIARLRAVEAVQPEFLSRLDELKAVGLDRVTEVLTPIFDDAQDIADSLQAIKDQWAADTLPDQVVADAVEQVTEAFADYRHRYLGAKATEPTTRDDGSPVGIGDMYFDTSLDAMRVLGVSGWKNAGSAVAGIMNQFAPIVATAGQTVFAVPGGYDPGYLIITVNGTVIAPADYTATDGANVTLASGLTAGDELAGVAFGAVTLSTVYTKAQVDAAFALIGASYTKAEADAKYALATASYSKAASDARYPNLTLSNLTDAAAARTNLGVGSAGTRNDSYFLRTGTGATGVISAGTAAPSGGNDGDIYLRYS